MLLPTTLSACATPPTAPAPTPRPLQVERQKEACPDPAARTRLGEGSTIRDALAAREQAVGGWEPCYAANEENTAE